MIYLASYFASCGRTPGVCCFLCVCYFCGVVVVLVVLVVRSASRGVLPFCPGSAHQAESREVLLASQRCGVV